MKRKKKINSKQKGNRGEREWAKFCKKEGFSVRRSVQYCGKIEPDAGDCTGLPYIHQEIKRTEKLNIYDAFEQSKRDAKSTAIPIVAHKRNHKNWLIIMEAKDWFKLYRIYSQPFAGDEDFLLNEVNDEQ